MNAAPWRLALCAGAFAAAVAAAQFGVIVAALVVALACAVAAVVFADRRTLTVAAIIVTGALGAWRGTASLAADHGPSSVAGHLGNGDVILRGTVGDSGVPGRDDTFVVGVADITSELGAWPISDGAVVVEPRTAVSVLPGDAVDVETTSLRAPPQRPGSLSAVALERVGVVAIASAAQVTVLARGAWSIARVAQELRRTLASAVTRALPEPAATLLLGIAFGIHGSLTATVRTPLQNAGLIHIVAVSGLKIVMLAGLVQALARVRGWTRGRSTLATLAVVCGYVVLSGAGAAALRSSLMVGAGLLLARDGRRPHSFAMLGLCAAILLGRDPATAADVGFQLSFLGTAGILLLAAPIAARLPGPRLLTDAFAVTVAAQVATAPVTAATFGVLSLVGPLANALVLPLLPLTLVAGGAGALLGALVPVLGPALGWLPIELAAIGVRVILAIAVGASALPFAAISLGLWPIAWTAAEVAAAIAALIARHMLGRRGGPSLVTVSTTVVAAALAGTAATWLTATATRGELRVTVLDVGNGVAVLVRSPGGGDVLVDGGSNGAALVTALGRVLSPLDRHLDAVVLTAADRSSAAAIPALLGKYDVGTLVVPQPLPPALQAAAAAMAGTGTAVDAIGSRSWSIDDMRVRCLPAAPAAGAPCVAQVTGAGATTLITGNLAQGAQDELTGMFATALRADLLVGPTTTAPDAALLSAVRPSLIAVPALRQPPGLGAVGLTVDVTGRDSDLEYDGQPSGGFAVATG
jgi:competence protein ComEC